MAQSSGKPLAHNTANTLHLIKSIAIQTSFLKTEASRSLIRLK